MITSFRQTADIFGRGGFCLRSVVVFIVRFAIPFNLVNCLGSYFYYRSLKTLTAGTVESVFASQSTFVYILSLMFLQDKFFILRVCSYFILLLVCHDALNHLTWFCGAAYLCQVSWEEFPINEVLLFLHFKYKGLLH